LKLEPLILKIEYKEAVVSNTTLKAYYLGKVNKIKCKNFNAFLHKVLSRKLIIDNADSHLLKTNMIVNKTAPIFKLYKLHGINAVINHYLEGTSRQLSERKGLTQNDRNGLIQLMFEHNYYAVFSDHAGVINFYTDPL
jgi:hypothetical protein